MLLILCMQKLSNYKLMLLYCVLVENLESLYMQPY